MDETTDVTGRHVANVIVGILRPNEAGKKFLLTTEVLNEVNHLTIENLFHESMSILWPQNIQYDDVLLFVTDAAPYIVKAAKSLQKRFTKMIHVTCLVHGLHRVCDTIRASYKEVDSFIANVKKIFAKAPSRTRTFNQMAPGVPLPPQPVLTRWGTWLEAVLYYATHYNKVVSVINTFNSEEASSIANAKSLISEQLLKELQFIQTNFGNLPKAITQLERSGIELSKSINIIEKVSNSITRAVPDPITERVKEKLSAVLHKNNGFSVLREIQHKIVNHKEMSDNLILYYSHAPITSCDTERSFSRYKNILSDTRRKFKFSNLKMHIVTPTKKTKTMVEAFKV